MEKNSSNSSNKCKNGSIDINQPITIVVAINLVIKFTSKII